MICKYNNVHPVTGLGEVESILHKKLNERFPDNIIDGDNAYYVYARENKTFLDFFGDWTNKDIYEKLLEEAENTNVFNEQGEPNLFEDLVGSYFLNTKGDKLYANNIFSTLTSTQMREFVNSFAGEYVKNPGEEIKDFIKRKLNNRIFDLNSFIIEEEGNIMLMEDELLAMEKENVLDKFRAVRDTLETVAKDNSLINTLEKRVIVRLNKNNFKYSEEISDKEDDMTTHEDIKNYILESNETSNRAINDVEILKFLASIPRFKDYNENVMLQEEEINPLLLTTSYMDQSEMWGILEGLFADVIFNPYNNNTLSKDIFDNYITKLEGVVAYNKHPELNYVLDYFKNKADDSFKTKMVNAFFKSKQNYLITQVEVSDSSKITFKVIDPAVKTGKEGKIADNYIETLYNSEINLPEILLNARYDFKLIKDSTKPEKYKKFLNDLLVNKLKLNINPRTINFYVDNNTKVNFSPLVANINKLLEDTIYNDEVNTYTLKSPKGELELIMEGIATNKKEASETFKDYLLRDRTFFKDLAKADAIFKNEVSESTVIVAGKQRWQYSYMSGIQLEILKWQSGDISSLLQLKDKGIRIVDFLLEDPSRIQNLKVFTNSEIKQENDSNPVLHKNITEIDLHLDIFAKMFNSRDEHYANTTNKRQDAEARKEKELSQLKNYLVYNFGADKNSLFSIFGLPRPNAGKSELIDKNGNIGKDFKSILEGYVRGELKRSQEEATKVAGYFEAKNKRDYLMKNLIPDFHYKIDNDKKTGLPKKDIEVEELTSDDFLKGNFFKAGIFTNALEKYTEDNFELVYENTTIPIVRESFLRSSNFNELMDIVYSDINKIVKDNFDYLNEIVLIDKEDAKGNQITKKLFDLDTNIQFENKNLALNTYIISSFINSYELSNLFNGHVTYYKQKSKISLDDFLKRAPAVAADGLYLRHRNTKQSKTYTDFEGKTHTIADKDDQIVVAVANNVNITKSKYADIISKGRKGNKLSYEHEIADAQGFVTAEHFRDLISRIYGWSDYDQQMYDELTDKDHSYTDENIRWIKKSSKAYTPLKMVHFEVNEQGVPIYLKYSLAPLFEAITGNSELTKLSNAMKKQGVEQLVFKSGSKASNMPQITIHKLDENNNFAGLREDINLNPFTIDASKSKMQVQLPTKMDSSITLGNQSIKNILSNIDINNNTDLNYEFRGVNYTGKDIYDLVNDTAVAILQTQLNSVLSDLGYKEGKFSSKNVKRLLLKQLDAETESDLKYLLSTELPLDTVPNFAQRAFPVLSSFLHKNAGKIYTNGSSVVQVANIGFDRLDNKSADNVFFFDKQTELTPPLPQVDKDGNIIYTEEGKMKIDKAKILLPFSSIFKESGISYNEFKKLYKEGKIDKRIFNNAIGYRIPNQAISSNDSFEIIGILPPIAGDQAIVYHEITAKTGSDFDIDKMYTMLPNIDVKKNYFIPEEHKWKFGKEIPHLGDMLETYTFDRGKEILNVLVENSEVRDFLFKELPIVNRKAPITTILKNYSRIHDILEDGQNIIEMDGEEINLLTLIEELKDAYSLQKVLIKDLNKELYKKYGEVESIENIKYIDNNTYRGKQNQLIELLSSILQSGASYDDLISPLDNPIIKETINDIKYKKAIVKGEITEEVSKDDYIDSLAATAMEEMFPVKLVKSRVDVLEAKTLISIMANNMTDLGESQKIGFGLKNSLGLIYKDQPITGLDRFYTLGKENDPEFKITKIVSYLMNSAVDAAKDNYIIEGNFNTYTANGAMLLVRLGLNPEQVFTILMNDSIMSLAKSKNHGKAKLSDFVALNSQEEMDTLSRSFLTELKSNDGDLYKVISEEDFLANNPNKKDLILGFWNLVQEVGKEFNESVVTTKADSNGAGKNISEFVVLKNRIDRVNEGTIQNSFKKWFKNGYTEENFTFNPNINNNPNVKYLGAMANNTLFLMEEISKSLFIESSPNTITVINQMASALGNPLTNDAQTIKLLYNYLYSNLLYNTGHRIYNMDTDKEKFLLTEFPSIVKKKQDKLNNAFLNELFIDSKSMENLIRFPNFKHFDAQDKLKLKEAFTELINKDIPFADALIQYAFLTTGFKSTHYSFNEFIPASYFIDNMHGKAIQEFLDKQNPINFEKTLTTIAKNNYNNFKIVKKLSSKSKALSGQPIKDEKLLKSLSNKDGSFKPFIIKGKSLQMLTNVDYNEPTYTVIAKVDNKKFKKYSYNNIEEGLIPQENYYSSNVKNIYEGIEGMQLEEENEESNYNNISLNTRYYEGNITPEPNTVFVFGSNPEGRHGAGAAKIARTQFGAKYGQGEGLQGNAYALPTKDLRVKENRGFKSISPEQITKSIKKLYEVAKQNPNKQFKIAYRNTNKTSLNGYTGLEMIEMFKAAGNIPSNIIFSKEWIDTGKLNYNIITTTSGKKLSELTPEITQEIWDSMTQEEKQNLLDCN